MQLWDCGKAADFFAQPWIGSWVVWLAGWLMPIDGIRDSSIRSTRWGRSSRLKLADGTTPQPKQQENVSVYVPDRFWSFKNGMEVNVSECHMTVSKALKRNQQTNSCELQTWISYLQCVQHSLFLLGKQQQILSLQWLRTIHSNTYVPDMRGECATGYSQQQYLLEVKGWIKICWSTWQNLQAHTGMYHTLTSGLLGLFISRSYL